MCIEATVQGDTAQCMFDSRARSDEFNLLYRSFPFSLDVLRSTGAQKLGWMALYVFIYPCIFFGF